MTPGGEPSPCLDSHSAPRLSYHRADPQGKRFFLASNAQPVYFSPCFLLTLGSVLWWKEQGLGGRQDLN